MAEERIRQAGIGKQARAQGFPETAATTRRASPRWTFGLALVLLLLCAAGGIYLLLRVAA
jgi:hypothetical protein